MILTSNLEVFGKKAKQIPEKKKVNCMFRKAGRVQNVNVDLYAIKN